MNGFRSAFSSSDLSNTRVTAPGSRSPNSAFCTGTLQYLSKKFAISANFTSITFTNDEAQAGSCTRSRTSFSHSLIDVLNFSNANGQWLLFISPLDVVGLPDCFRALGQARQAIDGVGGHADHVALLQSLCCAAQDVRLVCGELNQGLSSVIQETVVFMEKSNVPQSHVIYGVNFHLRLLQNRFI